MLRGVINTKTGLLLFLAALVAEPGWSLSREAQEFMDISAKLEPLQCERRKLRREIALAQAEGRDSAELSARFAALDRDPRTAGLEKRLAELQTAGRIRISGDRVLADRFHEIFKGP